MTKEDNNITLINENQNFEVDQSVERIAIIDFKMVTFSLAGKDYAIDIMQVKEIAKAGRFTYVPNTSPFVLGVYNLRGDIIPIIDLRMFFNIPVKPRKDDALESMIIVTVEEQSFGIVVDEIDKVVGISKNTIQPPHPIFGDINIKYIHGVVENQGRLYILLDVSRIFNTKKTQDANEQNETEDLEQAISHESEPILVKPSYNSTIDLDVSFLKETLPALAQFHVSEINEAWVRERYTEWKIIRSNTNLQLHSEEDAKLYLETFFSPHTGSLWGDTYASSLGEHFQQNQAKQLNVWNIGCGKGFETYSLAVLLKEIYPHARIRIYAHDSDLLAISNAPMLTIPENQITDRYKPWLVQNVSGQWTFNQEIKDMIFFEYHDCTHQNSVPNMDIILARDTVSFLASQKQKDLIDDFNEKLKGNGIIILGQNEAMPQKSGWIRNVHDKIAGFSKE